LAVEVTLTPFEVAVAGFVGVLRNTESMRKKSKDNYRGDNPFEINVVGAAGEMAAAKYLNVYNRLGINTYHGADIGIGLQVRTVTKPDGELPIREGDKPEELFIMVQGKVPTFRICGFISAAEGRAVGRVANPFGGKPATFVAQSLLHPIEELPIDRIFGGVQ
jgi:hypothetical protein